MASSSGKRPKRPDEGAESRGIEIELTDVRHHAAAMAELSKPFNSMGGCGGCNSMTWPHNRHGTWEPTPSGCAEWMGHERGAHVLGQRAPIAAWPTQDFLLARAIDGWQFAASLVDADCDGISSGAGSASAVTHHHSGGSWLQPGRVPTRSS